MAIAFTADVALEASVAAVQKYVDLIIDHDPDDGDHVVPGELRRFLARLRLLHGVPFSYLVPDAAAAAAGVDPLLLHRPRLDRRAGAGRAQRRHDHDRRPRPSWRRSTRTSSDEVDEAERTIREPHGEALLDGAGGTITGFLLRSRAVSGWPNLHVRAYSRDVLAGRRADDRGRVAVPTA